MHEREGFDLFLGDMAAHQRDRVGEVTGAANQALAVPLFERLDQKRAEQARRMTPASASAPRTPPPPTEERASDREAKRRGFRILREDDLGPEPTGDKALPVVATWGTREQQLYRAVGARVQLLLSKPEPGLLGAPSWRARAMAVLAVSATGKRELAARMMLELVRESEAAFGALVYEVSPKLYVGGPR